MFVFSVSQVGWYCQLPKVVCQNCWPPNERNQLSEGGCMLDKLFCVASTVFSFNSHVPFLSHGHQGTVVFLASLGWLLPSASWGGIPELLDPCWEVLVFRWKLCAISSHNQSLHICPWSHKVLLSTLVRASLDVDSTMYPACCECLILLWLFLAF